ncbi:hypothetical protein Moror_5527 [Moniliophthora roreri MCA 2997]|uniref:EF-hand domain-containing protein n=1 Tax=Moniliophthora roreri (strain MCA 2997) TaxID=1381753 RepID=V2X5Y4_MONRO|nr:hypothetical protein Moror_5527 [Moniliophthora roreri MCA 2997]
MATNIDPARASQSMEDVLQKVNKLIAEEDAASKRKSREKTSQRTRKILEYLQQGVAFADAIAGMNDYAGVAVKTFAKLLECEIARRRNSEEFVVVYQAFASTLFLVRYLEQANMEDIRDQLEQYFDQMNTLMQDFGLSAEVYYTKCKQAFVRFLKATAFEQELKEFTERAYDIQEKIRDCLGTYTAVTVTTTSEDVKRILSIVSNLPKATTKPEKDAEKIIQAAGDLEDVLMDDTKIAAIAKIFGDRVTSETKAILQQDLDELLAIHRDGFITKLDEATVTITTKIEGAQGEIMRKLNSGPHNLIDNEEFKKVWQDNGWKASVKCKLFVDEICGHFRNAFSNQPEDEPLPKDNWTLAVLTYVMFHPAIGDAIDDDGSGYVSVREFNKFLRQKPENWTVPELFAFWALGWQESIYNTCFEINDLVWEIEEIALEAKKASSDEATTEHIEAYLQVLDALTDITRWSHVTGYDQTFTVDVDYDADEMERLTEEYNAKNQEVFHHVTGDNGIIDAYSDLYYLNMRFDSRVELWFVPMVYQVLKLQLNSILLGPEDDEDAPRNAKHVTDYQWFQMDSTLEVLLCEFHSRMKTLLRGWRVQKLDSQLQVNSFFGGIFAGWFEGYISGSNKKVIARLERLEDADDDSDSEDASPSEVSELRVLVSELQGSVERLTGMVQSLLNKEDTSNSKTRQEAFQADAEDGDAPQDDENYDNGQGNDDYNDDY